MSLLEYAVSFIWPLLVFMLDVPLHESCMVSVLSFEFGDELCLCLSMS